MLPPPCVGTLGRLEPPELELPEFEPPELELPEFEPPELEPPELELPEFEPPELEVPVSSSCGGRLELFPFDEDVSSTVAGIAQSTFV